MEIVNIHEAKTHFSKLLYRVENGEDVIIARYGKPIAELRNCTRKKKTIRPEWGSCKGKIWMADDFDELPADILAAFNGESDEDFD